MAIEYQFGVRFLTPRSGILNLHLFFAVALIRTAFFCNTYVQSVVDLIGKQAPCATLSILRVYPLWSCSQIRQGVDVVVGIL